MLSEQWRLLEADFQRFYHLDLRVLVEVEGCRRLWTLVEGLPAEAMVWAELRQNDPEQDVVDDDRPVITGQEQFHQFMSKVVGG